MKEMPKFELSIFKEGVHQEHNHLEETVIREAKDADDERILDIIRRAYPKLKAAYEDLLEKIKIVEKEKK